MNKVLTNLNEPVRETALNKPKLDFGNLLKKLRLKIENFLFIKGYILVMIGFLLGRALILSELTPFILPFFASVFLIKKEQAPLTLVGLIAGAATLSLTDAIFAFAGAFLFLLFFRPVRKKLSNELKALPFFVAGTVFLVQLAQAYVPDRQISAYEGMMTGVAVGFAFILTMIFLQSLPLVLSNKRRHSLKTEEIVCLIIMLASVLTGTIGWTIYDLSLEHIMSMYLILVFAYVGGAAIGSTVGVITGLIFSLANMSSFYLISLLAFAGLLGGLLKEGKKPGAAVGLFISAVLIAMFGEGGLSLTVISLEAAAASLLFFLTPEWMTSKLARHIPGTPEQNLEQQQYLRKIRDVTSQRIERFSSVFKALSHSFQSPDLLKGDEDRDREFDIFLGKITENTCERCFRKNQCWAQNLDTTYEMMKEIITDMDKNDGDISVNLAKEWDQYCSKPQRVAEEFRRGLVFFRANKKLKKQVRESRKLVAEQLLGVSEVMDDFAKEIKRERDNHYMQEDMILEALQEFGVQVENVEIYSLEEGNVDIDITIPYCGGHGQCEKIIAPMLSDILGETIVVKSEECGTYPNGFCNGTFRSAKRFTVETGAAFCAKDGGFVSGDSYTSGDLGMSKHAVAISDGMGNGARAHVESTETLKLLQKILQSGIKEEIAIKSINSILSLRTTDEIFSTLDMAMIDLQNAEAKFLKIGSTPSFIKRGREIIRIQANNLPMGILQEVEVDVIHKQLKPGDLIIMMSDGVFEGPRHVENHDLWMKRKISELDTDKPQEVADLILEEVIRSNSGQISDDMTVVVTKIMHNTPKWATIPVQKFRKQA